MDALSGNATSVWLKSHLPMNACAYVAGSKLCLSPYFDVLAFVVVIALTLVLCKGIRESTLLNNVITALNLVVIGVLPRLIRSTPLLIQQYIRRSCNLYHMSIRFTRAK